KKILLDIEYIQLLQVKSTFLLNNLSNFLNQVMLKRCLVHMESILIHLQYCKILVDMVPVVLLDFYRNDLRGIQYTMLSLLVNMCCMDMVEVPLKELGIVILLGISNIRLLLHENMFLVHNQYTLKILM